MILQTSINPLTANVIVVTVCGAVFLGTVALLMTMRDMFRRRKPAVDRGLALGRGPLDDKTLPLFPTPEPPKGYIDRAFRCMVAESGTSLSERAAMMLILGCGAIGGAAVLVVTDLLPLLVLGVMVGLLIPIVYLQVIRWSRIRTMRAALPSVLEIVADALRSGKSLQQTFEMVSSEIDGLLGPEFQHSAKQLELGHAPTAVLNGMVQRVPMPEFRIFATAIAVHQHTGGNLALLTERLAGVARTRAHFLGHLGAVTAGGRLSAIGLIIGSILGVGALAMIQPTYLYAFFTNPYGPMLLAIAASLQILGIFWIWRILRVQF